MSTLPLVVPEVVSDSTEVVCSVLVIAEVDSVLPKVPGVVVFAVIEVALISLQMSPTMIASTGQHGEFAHGIDIVSVNLVQ